MLEEETGRTGVEEEEEEAAAAEDAFELPVSEYPPLLPASALPGLCMPLAGAGDVVLFGRREESALRLEELEIEEGPR